MSHTSQIAAALALLAIASCTAEDTLGYGPKPTTTRYTPLTASGLRSVEPYPNADDVCAVLQPSAATQELARPDVTLIACPKHERGALTDRQNEGAEILAHARHWTILGVPGR